jgi:Ni/Fe-hydrogenase subunit HybB-like protein
MERGVKECCGLNFKSVSFGELFLNKTMLFAYVLLAVGLIGWIQIYGLRFGHDFVNVKDMIGVDADNAKQLALAMKEQIFGMHHIEEVPRTEPWGIFVAQYTYLLYGGSALIFLTALAELFNLHIAHKASAALMTLGIALALGGMTSIASDWGNPLNIYYMILNPQPHSGMWMMLPLYSLYIPFTFVEIYFLMTNKRELAKKLALPLVIIGLGIDFAEFYIQGILFQLNEPRHLWTNFPSLWLYFLLTGMVSGIAFALIYAGLALREKEWYEELKTILRKAGIVTIILVALYETISGLAGIHEAPFSTMFWGYVVVGLALPLVLFFIKQDFLAAILMAIGTFIARELFVYAGNAEPMTNRFGMGPEAFSTYNVAELEKVVYEAPHTMEILIIIGCLGLGIAIFKLLDTLLDVSNQPH